MVAAATIPVPAVGAMGREISDQQLLARYVRQRDEAAFVELLRRHSRTVWGVCRRVLPSQEDAEDAFQAVFAILARKAAAIRNGEAVGSWLYGVAYRTAQRARRQDCQRRQRETQAPVAAPEPPAWCDAACRELQRLLDEEVQRLSTKYRVPFVLCCLEGMSKAEAARELGWKEGTVSGRLAKARKLLEMRLARRGVVLSAVLTATALAQQSAAAAAPTVLVQATWHALLPQAGAAFASLSPQALTLAHGVMHAMVTTKVALAAAVALAASVLIGGASLAALQDNPPPAQAPAQPQAVPPPPAAVELRIISGEPVMTLAFSPDGKRLFTGGGVQGAVAPVAVVPSPDPGRLPTTPPVANAKQSANRVPPPAAPGRLPPAGARVVAADPASAPGVAARFLQRPDAPGHLRIWDVDSGRIIFDQHGMRGVRALALSADGRLLATGAFNGELQLLDAQSLVIRAHVQAHATGCNSVAFSADGTLLASAGLDQKVKLWEVPGLKPRKEFVGHTDSVLSVAFFRHGRSIVSGSRDKTARIWDVETGTTTYTLKGHQNGIETVAVSPDDKLVATASWDKTMRLWDAETGKEQAVLDGANDAFFGASFSTDGKVLAGGVGNGRVYLWDVKTRAIIGTLEKHGAIVWALAFSSDGKRLASGSADGTAKIWDVATRKQIAALASPPSEILVAPPGAAMAQAQEQRLRAEVQRLQMLQTRDGVRWQVVPGAPPGTQEPAKSGSKLWLLSILALGLVTSYLAFWFYVRHTRKRETGAAPSRAAAIPTAAAPSPTPLLFACTACGKRLRVRAALAGKKVKCPQCNEAVPVPADPLDLAIRPAT